jgi:hypothetical protein
MTRNGEGGPFSRPREVAAAQHRLTEHSAPHGDHSLTLVQRALVNVDAALRELDEDASEREREVAVDLIRRRLRRELDRIAVAQERRAA